jgi:hypothetical protein
MLCGETPSLLDQCIGPGKLATTKKSCSLAKYPQVILANMTQTPTQRSEETEDMAEGSGSQKVNPNLVAEIVSSYVAKNSIPVDQVGDWLRRYIRR